MANITIITILIYFIILLTVSRITSKNSTDNSAFFSGEKKSPWYVVAFGMIGATLSGVTFISVPGTVGSQNFSYFQMSMGNLPGYWIIACLLIPMYYKMNLVSIYSFLEKRSGVITRKTASFFFIISKLAGASFRLFLVAQVIYIGALKDSGIPFFVTPAVFLLMIWLYTRKAGIKTVVRTDILQTVFMLVSLIITIKIICKDLNFSIAEAASEIVHDTRSRIFDFDIYSGTNFFKHFFSGIFMAVVMNGLDQDMMQKNLSCASAEDSKKNMMWFGVIQLAVVLLFLTTGLLMYLYAQKNGVDTTTFGGDKLFPILAFTKLGMLAACVFVCGITAAAFSSADSALTALTTSVCVDFLNMDTQTSYTKEIRKRNMVHFGFMLIIFGIITLFYGTNESIVNLVFKTAGYTYGPILGIFAVALFTKRKFKDKFTIFAAVISSVVCLFADMFSVKLTGYKFGFEILILNGLITFILIIAAGLKPIKNYEKEI